jgi:hypothetical protein
MNAGKKILAIARPVAALVFLGAMAVALGGCDRHRGSVHYYNDGGYYGDVAVYRSPPVVIVPRHHQPLPPVFRDRDGGRNYRQHR